ncbi:hypothetical protein [Flavihumibacter sp. CACIAM 22H1]|uniref:hypothetical protein n=1 Tax=Flavihumibacter sp. CACIAM 22H1 TaxID=1812911 RepID=UPI0007A8F632|nr:hypothetical protein [Flavihumibacter sp. CACIAM 22H1]KYP14009.1 MAG: hypothetical protein A1D16_02700 [Flavihumibacter sp. CACIAM 22H1]
MRIIFIFLSLFCFTDLLSQQFGGHPPAQRWKLLKTPEAFVLFPKGWDSTARRVAGLMREIRWATDSSATKLTKPVPILLQHQTTISNGYVALAPLRSEWYMTAPLNSFDLGSLPWPDQLGLHEQRHMQQYQRFNRGGARFFRWILGEQGQALANALTIPDWFFEGDAVYQETLLSRQGRGRMPSFYNGYRSVWEAGKNYSYQKLRNGSYRDYVPNHYQLGYLLVKQGEERYGPLFWKKVSADAAAMKGLFYPFQKAVKKHSGASFSTFRNAAIASSRELLIDSIVFAGKEPTVTDEENPVYTENGSLLFVRSGYRQIPAFYEKNTAGHERLVRVKDRSLDNYFSYAKGKLVYAAFQPAPRWSWKDYSTLQLLDLKTGKQQTITRKTKYFHPTLSPSGDTILTVELDASGQSRLHLLKPDGKLLQEIKNDSNYIYSFPAFYGKQVLTASRNKRGDMCIHRIDPVTGEHVALVPWTNHLIGYPKALGDSIIFTLSWNGLDKTMVLYNGLLASQADTLARKTGQYQPVVFKNEITTMVFTAMGYKLHTAPLQFVHWAPAEQVLQTPLFPQKNELNPAPLDNLLATIPPVADSVKPWAQTRQLFKFHSWTPWFQEPELSITAYSQNLLNSFQSQLTFTYNRNERFKKIGFSTVYGGLFPYLRAGAEYSFDRSGLFRNKLIRWNELELQGGLQLPLNLSKGRQISFLNTSADWVFNQPYFRQPEKDTLGNLAFSYLNYQLQYSIQSQQAKQHINPRWATAMRFQWRSAINRYSSRQWLGAVNQYLPGVSINHSLVLGAAFGGRDSLPGFRFSNNFPFARGFETVNTYRMQRIGLTYHLPLAYPDIGLGNIIYLLRIRAAGFFDWGQAKEQRIFKTTRWVDFRSTGLELNFDTRWWNQLPVSFGIRYAYLLDPDRMGGIGSHRWQFILPVNLIPSGAARLQAPRQLHF